jgi:hypothetical protein
MFHFEHLRHGICESTVQERTTVQEETMKFKTILIPAIAAAMIIIVPANSSILDWLGIGGIAYVMTPENSAFSSLVDVDDGAGMDDMDSRIHLRTLSAESQLEVTS